MLAAMTTSTLLEALDAALYRATFLEDALKLQRALVRIEHGLGIELPEPPIAPEFVNARWSAGEALVRESELAPYSEARVVIGAQVCRIVPEYLPETEDAAHKVSRLVKDLCASGSPAGSNDAALRKLADDDTAMLLAEFVRRQCCRPTLRAFAVALSPALGDVPSTRSRCPICGGEPVIAALTKPDGGRVLMCGWCDTRWSYVRLGCPYCDNRDTATLGYHLGDDPAHRLYFCRKCRCYLKTVDERERHEPACLPVEHTLTLGMDAAALEAGYRTWKAGGG